MCLDIVFGVDCMGFREFQEIRGFRGLNSRLRVVDGVDYVYSVSIGVNVNDGNDVGTDRAICPQISSFHQELPLIIQCCSCAPRFGRVFCFWFYLYQIPLEDGFVLDGVIALGLYSALF